MLRLHPLCESVTCKQWKENPLLVRHGQRQENGNPVNCDKTEITTSKHQQQVCLLSPVTRVWLEFGVTPTHGEHLVTTTMPDQHQSRHLEVARLLDKIGHKYYINLSSLLVFANLEDYKNSW